MGSCLPIICTCFLVCSVTILGRLVHSQTEFKLDEGCRGLLQVFIINHDIMDVFDPWSSSGAGGSGGDVPLYGGVWMNVCSKEFSEKEAQVVCRELECGNDSEHVQRVHPNRFNITSTDINPLLVATFPFSCSGSEDSLKQCQPTHTTCNFYQNNLDDIVALQCIDHKKSGEDEDDDDSDSSTASINEVVHTFIIIVSIVSFSMFM